MTRNISFVTIFIPIFLFSNSVKSQCTNGTPCDDGNPCTINDVCINGVCTGVPKNCSDGNPATQDFCAPTCGTCYYVPSNGNSCNDNNPCTENDKWHYGICYGTLTPVNIFVSSSNNSGSGTLRDAISSSCEGDTIRFDNTVDTVDLSEPITINKSLVIIGNGFTITKINGQLMTKAFHILENKVLFLHMCSMINCKSIAQGGAFYNQGIVVMKDLIFLNNFEGITRKAFTNVNSIFISKPGIVTIFD